MVTATGNKVPGVEVPVRVNPSEFELEKSWRIKTNGVCRGPP